jgi:protein-tyrosine-phosphatase
MMKNLFKRTKQTLDEKRQAREALTARLQAAEADVDQSRADAVHTCLEGADAAKQAVAEEKIHKSEISALVLKNALAQLSDEILALEEEERQKADRAVREETSRQLHKLADDIEKTGKPIHDVLTVFREAFEAAGHILGPSGWPQLLQNMSVEIPQAGETYVAELRARAVATLENPATLATLPQKPKLEVIKPEPAPPTIQIFSLQTLAFQDYHGKSQVVGAYHYHALPPAAAKEAIRRNLALPEDSDRIRELIKNPPHLLNAGRVFDLDEDPDAPKKVDQRGRVVPVQEPIFQEIDRGPARPASWIDPHPVEPPQPGRDDEQF